MHIDYESCARLLNSFTTNNHARQGKQLHLLFLKSGILNAALTIGNRLIQMYMRCDHLDDARKLFDEMPVRNSFTWNALFEGFVQVGNLHEYLGFFHSMPSKNDFSWNLVISSLSKAGELDVAHRLFWDMPRKNGMAFNSLLHGYVRVGCPDAGLRMFKDCLKLHRLEIKESFLLDSFVLATSVGACTNLKDLERGKQIHARVIVDGVEVDSVLGSSLVNMYAKCGDVEAAGHVFHSNPNQDDFSLSSLILGYASCGRMNDAKNAFSTRSDPCPALWNSLISGYIANEELIEAFQLFDNMRKEGVPVDSTTFTSILSACNNFGDHRYCLQLHSVVTKLGFLNDVIVVSILIDTCSKHGRSIDACSLFNELNVSDTVLLNCMITIYSNCGRIEDAKDVFDKMHYKTTISWNSIIAGLNQNGCPLEALIVFCKMNTIKLKTDKFSLASAISACGSISFIEFGEQVFARTIIVGLNYDQIISSSLVDFYFKCGFVENGRKIFNQNLTYDVVLWNSMLMGCATNGLGTETVHLFHRLIHARIIPTDITFIAVLSACGHCGLIEEAEKWFHAMKHEYNIDPKIEHYSCMIDLYARAGYLNKGLNLIENMPFKADASMWLSILRGCVAHGDRHLGKEVAELVMKLDSKNSGTYVQLSNIFATFGEWKDSAVIRELMKGRKIQKNPGQSWGYNCK